MRQGFYLLGILVLVTTWSCRSPQTESIAEKTEMSGQHREWDAFVDEFIESFLAAHPMFAVVAGRYEYAGQLPDWSRQGIAREIQRLHEMKDKALSFADGTLDPPRRYQKAYVSAKIDRDLFWLEDARWPFRNPEFYFDWMLDSIDPSVYTDVPYAPIEERMKAFIKFARALADVVPQIEDNLESPLPRPYIEFGVAAFGGFHDYFTKDAYQPFAEVADPELQEQLGQACQSAALAMKRLSDGLESQREAATEDFALGKDLFQKMLYATERVDLPVETLLAVGEADLARNLTALENACGAYAPGLSIEDCIAKVQDDKPEGGAVQGARDQLAGLKAFLIEKQLLSIPGTEEALVKEAPPYNRSNFAYINIPGPYAKDMPSVYYIAPPDPNWPEAEQRAYVPGKADLLFTSVHEVWPGHFLQFLHANRSDWLFGRLFVGYAFAEGWAHYTEEMMWEAGLGGDPATHIGQLLNALLRNVRFISAIGLHTGGMSVAESERLFREKALQDPGNARQQAVRGTYDPAYLNYTMGKLMIMRLREDWTASRGGRDAWPAFHDAFLSYGGPPIPLVRGMMMETQPETAFPK